MKKMKEKGFTLVELVIVIAVIAILAAILIPTFSTLIRKSSISSDIVLAKNLNTAVGLYKGETGKTDIKFPEALKATNKSGYVLSNLNAKAKDSYFVWEDDTDQFLFVEFVEMNGDKPIYKVLYSNDDNYWRYDIEIEELDDNKCWVFATSDIQNIEETKTKFEYATFLKVASDSTSLIQFLGESSTESIYFNEDIILGDSDNIQIPNNKNIEINLCESKLVTNTATMINMSSGELAITNGSIKAEGEKWFAQIEGGKLTFDNVQTEADYAGVIAPGSKVSLTIKDSSLKSQLYNVVFQSAGGIAEIENSNFEAPTNLDIANQATVIIKSGKFKSNYIANLNNGTVDESKKAKLIIQGGDFTFTEDVDSDKKFIFNFWGNSTNQSDNILVEISGGTFNGKSYTEYFEKYLTDQKWIDSIKNLTSAQQTYKVIIYKEVNESGKVVYKITRDTLS